MLVQKIFFNDLPLWKVPNLFSWQHVVLMLFAFSVVALFCVAIKKKKNKTQDIVFKILSVSCLIVFCGRFLWGYDSLIYTPSEKRVGFWYQTLLPLELCNLGIFFLMLAAFTKRRFWYMICFYITLFGGITAFICFPNSHQYPLSTIVNFQFFDYYFIHMQLVALPVAFVVTKRYTPSFADAFKSIICLTAITFIVCLISLGINAIYDVGRANYMWTLGEEKIPLLRHLWALIGIPFFYLIPLMPFVLTLYLGVSAFFAPKRLNIKEKANASIKG